MLDIMTRMLYIAPLKDRPNIPEEIQRCTWRSLKAGGLRLERFYLGNCTLTLALTYVFWGLGLRTLYRRYQ
jgi:hypothetical protein